jgi:arsenate reductase
MLRIYHNPRCAKSRAGLQYLKAQGVDFEVVEYLKKHMMEKDLTQLLIKLNMNPLEIIRTGEKYYKKKLKGKKFHDHEWIRIICEHPELLKRPIVEGRYKAVVGDPTENIDTLISKK